MAKTRSQTRNIKIIKEEGEEEEEEDDCKPTLHVNGVTRTTRNRITKPKPSKNKNKNKSLPAQQDNMEEDTDTKPLLKSTPESSELAKGQRVSQEQINQLIDAIVNDNMTIAKAARTVKLSFGTVQYYYNIYMNDPDKKIPSPRNQLMCLKKFPTHKDIENLIKYINKDKMTVKAASEKANISSQSGYIYYNKYLNDPDHNVPKPRLYQSYTQDQKDEFIGYIVNDKMSIMNASKKANMSEASGITFYRQYRRDHNIDVTPNNVTQEQINQLISYIVDDKMSLRAASKKANMHHTTGGRHYKRYLNNQ